MLALCSRNESDGVVYSLKMRVSGLNKRFILTNMSFNRFKPAVSLVTYINVSLKKIIPLSILLLFK
jgi:hypothetical protein